MMTLIHRDLLMYDTSAFEFRQQTATAFMANQMTKVVTRLKRQQRMKHFVNVFKKIHYMQHIPFITLFINYKHCT